ncbi:hypothetical protein [Cyanobium sp. CH-040]|uniref:hypothetical protein n=1 Tax=Cyanobium sp. CH-040 TaxID=2823708 RepID=UPI0020CE7749|nr:hypothetical protein [Cyanobium sp. CH-040]MCP9928196.1 hypothetical protein [Cyanobium sp. CH-040]
MRPNPLRGWPSLEKRLPATVAAGVTVGSLSALTQISFGALLFSGSLAGALAEGVGNTLLGGVVIGAVQARETRRLLQRSGILQGDRKSRDWFSDLDLGLEFCENELLSLHATEDSPEPAALVEPGDLSGEAERGALARLLEQFEPVSFPAGSTVIEQGAANPRRPLRCGCARWIPAPAWGRSASIWARPPALRGSARRW